MTKFTEGRHPGEFILSEANFTRSRGVATIAFSQTIKPGMILAKLAVPADVVATPSAKAANTGNATIAMGAAPNTTSKVKDGRYKGIAVTATTVRWEDPTGKEIGTSTHGAEFNKGGVKFTITAGGTPNVAGDEFYVDVAADAQDFQYVAYNPAGADGSEEAVAIAIYGVTTPADATAKIAIFERDGEVVGANLEWPDGIVAADKANAIQALADFGIIVR